MYLAVGYVILCQFFAIYWCLAGAVKAVSSFLLSFFWCFDFKQLIITCLGKAVFSVSINFEFLWFSIDAYLNCSSYSFIMCGWVVSIM